MNRLPRTQLIDSLILVVLASALIFPLFGIVYLDNWPSIESTFISDARILAAHLPHPGWQPLWYCGTRFDYIYPPALRYGTALIAVLGNTSTARAYHIYVGIFYIFGLVSVYWLTWSGSRSRRLAWLSSIAVALVSPSLLLIRALHNDSPWMVPQRLHVLMSYGEGPHISALSILPAALAASFAALRGWRPVALASAGALCALVVANNFYGATALAIYFPVAVWSVWVGVGDRMVWARGLGIAALAYGLSAFWLTPSYLRITWMNLKWVSAPGDTKSRLILLVAIVLFCAASLRWAKARRDLIWTVFVSGATLILAIDVLGFYWAGLHILGEAPRLAPEMDLAILLLLGVILNALWNRPKLRIEAAALAILMCFPAVRYLRHAYTPFVAARDWQNQYEHRITRWVHENLRGERVLATGTNRFWFDAWYDNAEPDGGSDQGMLNQILPAASFQIRQNERSDASVLWLQALGTAAIIVPDKNSLEYYHDYVKPEKFQGVLPAIFDDQHGTVIYRVPRIHPSLGRVVDQAVLAKVNEVRSGDDVETLQRYVAVIEAPAQPETPVSWSGFDNVEIKATVAAGHAVLFQETYDPAWHASEGGNSLAIHRDPVMGFMLIDVPPGLHTIHLRFETPFENRAGQVLFVISLLAMGGMIALPKVRRTGQLAPVSRTAPLNE